MTAAGSFDHAHRHSRQVRFASVGAEGQRRLGAGRVVVVGCGALGTASAMALLRSGVGTAGGFLRLVDRDLPETSNLPRQILFDEADVAAGFPKAAAARRRLEAIDSSARIEAVVADLTATNASDLLAGADVIVDGTDNFEARFLINEWACRAGVPWVHGGAISAEGRVMTVVPGRTACLRCLVPEPPAAGALPTCDTAGIIGPAAFVVGAVQAAETMKLLVEGTATARPVLLAFDLWEGRWRSVDLSQLAAAGCPTCRDGDSPWLEGRLGGRTTVLCGRDAVQVASSTAARADLASIADRLRPAGRVTVNEWLVRAEVEPGITLSIFADGRAIVQGTRDESRARGLLARYVGS
jgi:molybdopterin/thiamine biosynthesis adenylyltransferase